MATHVPEQYRDLLDRPIVIMLSTVLPDGQPHSTPVWCDYVIEDEQEFVRVNSADGRQKVKDMEERPQATIGIIDPNNPYRWMELRGTVAEITREGAVDHINKLSLEYTGRGDYFVNMGQPPHERIIFKIKPHKVIARG